MKIFGLITLVALSAVLIDAAENKETLVLLDSLATRETHSIFFKSLQGKKSKPFTKGQLIEIVN
jgi:hypothetical protein